jgi:DNA-binding PadR family transcriptional regulator
MYRLSPEGQKFLKYEDIVVGAFESWPKDFQLAGHPQYPDASDLHKPLYDRLKKQGYVESSAKQFRLTPKGFQLAQRLEDPKAAPGARRLDRETRELVERLRTSDAVRIVATEQYPRLLDTHFHSFFRTSPRLTGGDFTSRLEATKFAVEEAAACGEPDAELLARTRAALLEKFDATIVADQSLRAIRR